jgi:shikimate dehydrogenase
MSGDMSKEGLRRACVVGWPIAHSRSPLIHSYWLRALGIKGDYFKIAVLPEDFSGFTKSLGKDGLVGANVTLPHKEAAFAACDWLTSNAADLGAVNTLWLENGKLCGDNTDVGGFLANLDDQAPGWRTRTRAAIVLGAGGAARAIVHGLLSSGLEEIAIVNRTADRAERLVAQFGPKARAEAWSALPQLLGGADLIVNTTSLGMPGQPDLDIPLDTLNAQAIVADIVYTPLQTSFLKSAKARGRATVEGLGMLLHQAAPGFERWFGVRPQVTPELRSLIEADIVRTTGKVS